MCRQPEDKSVVKGLKLRNFLHNCRVEEEEDDEEDFDIGKDYFNAVIYKFNEKKNKSYDFPTPKFYCICKEKY